MQKIATNSSTVEDIMLAELWNFVVFEGSVEYSFSGPFNFVGS
jgi:hypothetical protein